MNEEIGLPLLILAIAIAIFFDIINGFHDAANSIATIVSTKVLKPFHAVIWAAFFNFMAMFLFAPKVADTISKIVRIEFSNSIYFIVIVCGLLGAIVWNLITWRLGLPTSSSHSLIGGLAGAGLAHAGLGAIRWEMLIVTMEFIFLAPIIGFILGTAIMLINYRIFQSSTPFSVDRLFRKGQLFSAALYSLGHGANDAQKTMGVIIALLVAAGMLPKNAQLSLFEPSTSWIIIVCYLALSVGTLIGGWRIVKTMGMKITRLTPMGGFSAETAGGISILLATYGGIPVSTTQIIAASIMGVGSVKTSFSNLKWGIAAKILWAWVLTMPFAGLIAAIFYYLSIAIKLPMQS